MLHWLGWAVSSPGGDLGPQTRTTAVVVSGDHAFGFCTPAKLSVSLHALKTAWAASLARDRTNIAHIDSKGFDHCVKCSLAVTIERKYVNMADVNFKHAVNGAKAAPGRGADTMGAAPVAPPYDLIELLFFAYRDFTSDPDAALAEYGFGRAHHRVLHFVNRNPGLRVTDLLAILKITKQSLGRVLKQLVDEGFIEQAPGPIDRRERLLFATPRGRELAERLTALQSSRIARALERLPEKSQEIARRFLFEMIDPDQRSDVMRLIERRS